MNIYGFQSLTLLDYPGHIAATIFTGGCNYHCPFCHNGDLLTPTEPLDPEAIFCTLEKRRHMLNGICITGGEPTLHRELPDLIQQIRNLGYPVKLDTNGTNPTMLKDLIENHQIDYVAMDIKNAPDQYISTAGSLNPHLNEVKESVSLLMKGSLPFEFRTTLVPELHTPEQMHRIGQWIAGAPRYYLQAYRESAHVLSPIYTEPNREWMEAMRAEILPLVPTTEIRGID